MTCRRHPPQGGQGPARAIFRRSSRKGAAALHDPAKSGSIFAFDWRIAEKISASLSKSVEVARLPFGPRRSGREQQETTMQYMLLLHHDDTPFTAASPEDQETMSAPYMAYNEALIKAGAMVSGERLRGASSATTVRVRDGKTEVLDGPFATTKEQLGGFYIIEAPDLDAALGWAARCPSANYGIVEVRPIWPTR
jgi:hypothetical protein